MSKYLRFWPVVVAALFLFVPSISFADTIQDVVEHVLQTNPDIRATAYNRLARDEEVKKAKSGYYPSLDISAGVGIDKLQEPFKRTLHPRSGVLSLNQNLFHFGTTTNEVRRQKSRVQSQAYLLQANSEVMSLQTARVFLDVLRAEELHELAKENLLNHQKIADQMRLRSESGVERRADLDQVLGRLALAQSNVVATQANLQDAKTNYIAVTCLYPRNLVKPDPVDFKFPVKMEEAVQMAVENYPLLKSAKADLAARHYQFKAAKSDAYPSLDLTSDYRWEYDVDEREGYAREFTAAMVLSINLFRGWYDKARIAETAHQIREAEEIYKGTHRETAQSVKLSWEAYRAAAERVAHLEKYVEASRLTAEAFSKQWMVGRRTMFDVLDSQAEFINARKDLVNASYDKLLSEYRVLSGMGKLVHTLGLEWPEESSPEVEPESKIIEAVLPRRVDIDGYYVEGWSGNEPSPR
jgi:adhesin transport system outer membrane protein